MRYKPTKIELLSNPLLEIKTETGHIVKFKLEPHLSTDIDAEDNGNPFFYLNLIPQYEGVETTSDAMSLEKVREHLNDRNLIKSTLEYDHIQVGFIYAADDPNNHRWMLNFMDVNNKYITGYIGDKVQMNCAFTTTSWEDGVWHGRFVVYKKDVEELIEPEQGKFVLNGKNDIGDATVSPLEAGVDKVSLRYNIHSNMWYADMFKLNEKIGEMPCKNIICNVPFKGVVDKSQPKPRVTAELDVNKVDGISLALNALIIKQK